MTTAGGDDLEDKRGQGLGEHDGFAAQTQPHFIVAALDVIEGEAADRGRPLGVEQHEQASDTVLGLEGVVLEQPAGLFPPCLTR